MTSSSTARANDLEPILTNARYFVMKATTDGNLKMAKEKSVWSTSVPNELLLNQAFKLVDNVLLFFALDGSPYLQGIARMAAPSTFDAAQVQWECPVKSKDQRLRGLMKIDWISTKAVGFSRIGNVIASLERGEDGVPKVLSAAGDGSEIKAEIGKEIAAIISSDAETNLGSIHRKIRSYDGPEGIDTSDQDICKPPTYDDYMKYYFPELAVPVKPGA